MSNIKYIRIYLFIVLSLLFTACGGGSSTSHSGSGAYITTWKTDNQGKTEENQIEISTDPEYTYNFNIDWGDGNTNKNVSENIVHTYAKAGTYTVKITGEYPHIYFDSKATGHFRSVDDRDKILSVEKWGGIPWKSMQLAFYECKNLKINASDKPNLALVHDMSNMFTGVNNLDIKNINEWDVSNVVNMNSMFQDAKGFNNPLNNWNVSNVRSMYSMFKGVHSFNQPLNNWNVSNVTDMRYMFQNTITFNQDIGNWDVSSVTTMAYMFANTDNFNQNINNWNVSAVTNMEGLFYYTKSFNMPLNNWNVSSVENMYEMFSHAENFNQNINSWDISSVSSIALMFANATMFNQSIDNWNITSLDRFGMHDIFYGVSLSTQNYDALLNSWSAQAVNKNVIFGRINSQYSASSKQARDRLVNEFQWIIVDKGMK